MRIAIFTLFPQMFAGPFDASIVARARAAGSGEHFLMVVAAVDDAGVVVLGVFFDAAPNVGHGAAGRVHQDAILGL